MCMNPDEKAVCGCGKNGHLEQYASATGITRMAALYLEEHPQQQTCLRALASSDTIWVPTVAATHAFIDRPGFDPAVTRRTVETQLEMVRRASELGAKIAAGSDSGAVGVMHGEGTRTEYRLLREAGLTDAQLAQANRALAERFVRRDS